MRRRKSAPEALREYIRKSGRPALWWAGRFDIAQSTLSMLMTGKKRPSLSIAARIERETHGHVRAVWWVEEIERRGDPAEEEDRRPGEAAA